MGNGELCFPRDEVPNNYTGYGDREYSWQANLFVSHLKPDVYQVETKVVIIGGHYLCEENRNAVDWVMVSFVFPVMMYQATIPDMVVGNTLGKQTTLFHIPNQMYIELKPKQWLSPEGGILDVSLRLHDNRSIVDWLGNHKLCFPPDDVPNNYTGYGGREYSWKANPSVSHPKPDVYRVDTKAMVVTGGHYSNEALKLNIALIEIGLIFLIIFKEYQMSPFACMIIAVLLNGPRHPIVTIPLLPDFGGVTDGTRAKNHAPGIKKKSIKKIVEKRVAKAIEKYEKTRADSNNTGGSESTNTGGTVVQQMQWKHLEDDKVKFAMCTFEGRALTWWNGNVQTLGLANANQIPWSNKKKESPTMARELSKQNQFRVGLQELGKSIKGNGKTTRETTTTIPITTTITTTTTITATETTIITSNKTGDKKLSGHMLQPQLKEKSMLETYQNVIEDCPYSSPNGQDFEVQGSGKKARGRKKESSFTLACLSLSIADEKKHDDQYVVVRDFPEVFGCGADQAGNVKRHMASRQLKKHENNYATPHPGIGCGGVRLLKNSENIIFMGRKVSKPPGKANWGRSLEQERKPQAKTRFLQQPEIPEWKWEKITMDFVTKLPKSSSGHEYEFWVVVEGVNLLNSKLETEYTLVSPWKGVVRFGKKGKLAPRYVGPFEIVECVGPVAYRLKLPQELSCVHDTFHVSNLKKCLVEPDVQVPLDEIEIDENLRFVEEPIEIVERDVKKLKRRKIPLVKVRWNSRQGAEYTWEREDQFRKKYPNLFSKTVPSSGVAT
ncbi:hypothetical protein Tco_0235979 [Tanacetum coccineum]